MQKTRVFDSSQIDRSVRNRIIWMPLLVQRQRILLTSFPPKPLEDYARNAGIIAILAKPYDPSHTIALQHRWTMLSAAKIVAFVPTIDAAQARSFYESVLGLHVVSEDPFALVFDANGTMLRVTSVQNFKPQQFTIVGWEVTNIEEFVSRLSDRGVKFENYGMPGQDVRGIWKSPSGARIAWFKDPDGNVLSLTQFP